MRTPQDEAGGPAFPRVEPSITGEPAFVAFGLSARDYFAAKAIPAILMHPTEGIQGWGPMETGGGTRTAAEVWAKQAYQIADAMLAAREAR